MVSKSFPGSLLPRTPVDRTAWESIVAKLADRSLTLTSLWGGDAGCVHMAVFDPRKAEVAIVSLDCPEGTFPSVGRMHAPAIRLERTVQDLFGLTPVGAEDARPWLDHGRWPATAPLGAAKGQRAGEQRYNFLPTEGEGLHTIPVGPVHAGIIEPGHFRFTANGETIVRLEERLGYVHKGIDRLVQGQSIERAGRVASRVSGDSTVAYAFAYSLAVEAALGFEAPPRAQYIRALMAELERLANHCGDIGAICNDATFTIMHAHCAILRENVLRTADGCFGHRLMMDRIVPGGVACDLKQGGERPLRALLALFRRRLPKLIELYDNSASLQDRTVTTGVLQASLAEQFGCGGFVGRASGRAFDARKTIGYAPYDRVSFDVPVLTAGDVNARVWVRIREVEQSLALIEQLLALLAGLPDGVISVSIEGNSGRDCEGASLVESFRGDVFAWVKLAADGTVARCHLRDPSWFQWPLLEAAIEGNIVADFPLCNKSFNCSYSGHDL